MNNFVFDTTTQNNLHKEFNNDFIGYGAILENSSARNSKLIANVQIVGCSKVINSMIVSEENHNVLICGNSEIINTELVSKQQSIFSNSTAVGCVLMSSLIVKNSVITDVYSKAPLIILENAVLDLRTAEEVVHTSLIIRNEKWDRIPKSAVASNGIIVTEAKEDKVSVGCLTKPVEKFFTKASDKYSALYGLNSDVAEEIRELILNVKNNTHK